MISKPFTRNSFYYLSCVAIISILMGACSSGGNTSERPSPLVIDSIDLPYTKLTIQYSSPRVRDRQIWNTKLVPYGKIWRTGANEATIFQTSDSIVVADKVIPPGKYALFTIPNESKWIIILNKEWSQWGAYSYKAEQDIARFEVIPEKTGDFQEMMKFSFINENVVFHWENLTFSIPITRLNQ